jgi:uncharacterized protein with ATP-grasp and redox domains
MCNWEFQKRFKIGNLILAVGMGDYETLSEIPAAQVFLFQV